MQLLAMVGFAEGIVALSILELWVGTAIVAALALVAFTLWLCNSRIAAFNAGVAILVVDFLIHTMYFPWSAFFAKHSDDGDWNSLLDARRVAEAWWVGVSVAACAVSLWVMVRSAPRERRG